MKIIFDQCAPAPLRHWIAGRSADTAFERRWSDLRNGDLLDRIEKEGCELLITTDQNPPIHQNLANGQFAVLALMSNRGRVFNFRPEKSVHP